MLPTKKTVRSEEVQEEASPARCSSPCRRDGRGLCLTPCPPTTQSQVRRKQKKNPVSPWLPHPGVNTAMMSQFCSKFWGLLSPTHSDSSQNGAENISSVSGGRDEMGEGGQKLQPHSGRKTEENRRLFTKEIASASSFTAQAPTLYISVCLLLSPSSFHLSFSKIRLFHFAPPTKINSGLDMEARSHLKDKSLHKFMFPISK